MPDCRRQSRWRQTHLEPSLAVERVEGLEALDAELDHIEHVKVKHAAYDEVVRPLLVVAGKEEDAAIVLLAGELQCRLRAGLKRPDLVVARKLLAVQALVPCQG